MQNKKPVKPFCVTGIKNNNKMKNGGPTYQTAITLYHSYFTMQRYGIISIVRHFLRCGCIGPFVTNKANQRVKNLRYNNANRCEVIPGVNLCNQ